MITEKLELTFIGGLAALEIPKQSTHGAGRSLADASSLITLERENISPSTKRSSSQLDDEGLAGYAWIEYQPGRLRPFTNRSDSITGKPFNQWSIRAIWLSLATWGELSMVQLLSSINSNGHKSLESSVSGVLARAVNRNLLKKKGKGIGAKYRISESADHRALAEYLPFRPSNSAICAAKARAKRRGQKPA